MKKLLAGFLSACLALSVAGCSASPNSDTVPTIPTTTQRDMTPTESPQDPVRPQSMHALALPNVREEIFSDDGTLLFALSYQKAQVILADESVEEAILGDIQTRIGSILSDADQIYADAQTDYPDKEYWSHYFIDVAYTPTRLDQVVMSLFGNECIYSGGAHPFVSANSVTYDLQTGQVLGLEDILYSNYSKDALCALVLDSLETKSEELSYGYQDILTERFTGDLTDIQNWYFSRSGLCFHFSPYDIAPYSAGTIIAELPYGELTDLLQEQYFPTLVENATGSMYAQVYDSESAERFSFIADVALDEESTPIMLYSDATVTDVRIETGTVLEDSNSFISTGVVFMADTVSIGDAIQLSANLTDNSKLLRLVYRSGDHEVSSMINWDSASNSVTLSSN